MGRPKPEATATTWQDLAECVGSWEAEYGVCAVVELSWRHNLSAGAFVEVVLYDARTVGRGVELVRMRGAFPARKMTGQAGAVLHVVFQAFQELDTNPWLWPADRRARVRGEL